MEYIMSCIIMISIDRVCVGIPYAICLVKCSMVAESLMTMINDCSTHLQR
jgi:hypothetical protein